MAFESVTDEKIAELIAVPKQVMNPGARPKAKDGREQYNYKLKASGNEEYEYEFELYTRQNLREGMENDFSCGISWIAPNGEGLTFKRYNGPSHNHLNHLERAKIGYACHIHTATAKYIKANRKAEGYAEATDRYNSLRGALHCLVGDCNISGLKTEPDQTKQTERSTP
jgi:hypothetical protein